MLFPGWRGGQGGDRGSKPEECISATAHAWHAPSAEPQVRGRLISASAVRGVRRVPVRATAPLRDPSDFTRSRTLRENPNRRQNAVLPSLTLSLSSSPINLAEMGEKKCIVLAGVRRSGLYTFCWSIIWSMPLEGNSATSSEATCSYGCSSNYPSGNLIGWGHKCFQGGTLQPSYTE